MKKLLAFVAFVCSLSFLPVQASAGSTGMTTSFVVSVEALSGSQVKVSWNTVSDVQEYRICRNSECSGPDSSKIWTTILPPQTYHVFNQPLGTTSSYWVHAVMQPNATRWTWTDDRPNSFGLKWDNSPVVVYTNNWVDPYIQEPDGVYECYGNCKPKNEKSNFTNKETTNKAPKTTVAATTTSGRSWNSLSQFTTSQTPKIITMTKTTLVASVTKPVNKPTIIEQPTIIKGETTMFGMNDYEFVFIFLSLILAAAIIYYVRTSDSRYARQQQELREERDYEMKLKDKEIEVEKLKFEQNRMLRNDDLREKEIVLQHQRSEYELKELSKTKIQNEHEQNMKKIDHDTLTERFEHSERQLKDERQYSLDQQKIAAQNTEQVLNYVMPIMQGRDAHELKMAEIKAFSSNSILDADDVTEAKVKFSKK